MRKGGAAIRRDHYTAMLPALRGRMERQARNQRTAEVMARKERKRGAAARNTRSAKKP
jgi:hypothetical protein